MQLPRLKIGDFGCAQRDNGQQRLVLLSISDWLTRTVQAGASEELQFPTSSQAGSAAFHPPEVSLFKVGAGRFWAEGREGINYPRIPRDGGQLCIPCVPRSAHRWLLTFGRLGFASTAF